MIKEQRNWIKEILEIDVEFFADLEDSYHSYSSDDQNPYHLEHGGNVLGHVLDVHQESKERFQDDEILQLAALLHDIAKPACREANEETKHVSFFNHESLGVFKAVGMLNKLDLDEVDKVRVLEIIQRHADSYKLSLKNLRKLYDTDTFQDAMKIRECDMFGRVALEGNRKDIEAYEHAKAYEFNGFPELQKFKKTCTFLVGPPASGKTTSLEGYEGKILSRDNCLMELAGTENYSEAWGLADQKAVDKLFEERLKELADGSEDFVIDMTLMNAKSRRKFTERLKNKFNLKAKVFLTDYDELIRRNKARDGKAVKEYIVENMCKRFQMPYEGEGFTEIEYAF